MCWPVSWMLFLLDRGAKVRLGLLLERCARVFWVYEGETEDFEWQTVFEYDGNSVQISRVLDAKLILT